MAWVEVFAVLLVCHGVGDFVFQTDWQARMKHHGLGRHGERRALVSHMASYLLAFVPALAWLSPTSARPSSRSRRGS